MEAQVWLCVQARAKRLGAAYITIPENKMYLTNDIYVINAKETLSSCTLF